MGIYNVKVYDADGHMLRDKDCNGSCTGVFQANGNGYFSNYPTSTRWAVTISLAVAISEGLFQALVGSKLIQALSPGMTAARSQSNSAYVVLDVPNIDSLPADQVITALRILKSFGEGYYIERIKTLREYELTADELVVLAAFGTSLCAESDSYPCLAGMTRQRAEEAFRGRSYIQSDILRANKLEPQAGMLLPLIRGEINPGWQQTANKGYYKEGAFLDNILGSDSYDSTECFTRCLPEYNTTVNHPIIIRTPETLVGPIIPFREIVNYLEQGSPIEWRRANDKLAEVTEWVLQQLGK